MSKTNGNRNVANNSAERAKHEAIAEQIEAAKLAPEAIALADETTLEAKIKAAVEAALASQKATRKATSAGGADYSMYSEGAAALIRACGQRPQNDRARFTAFVYDRKRVTVKELCEHIGFVSDRHGNKTSQVFNRADCLRVLPRVNSDLFGNAGQYLLAIKLVVVDNVEYLQLFDRSEKAIEPVVTASADNAA